MLFLQSNSTHYNTFYKDVDGVYKWGAAAPETLEGLKLWYEAYSSGLLDPEFFLLNAGEDMPKFNTTMLAAQLMDQGPTTNVQSNREAFTRNTGLNGDDHVHLATILGTDGYYHQRDLINFWATICFSPKVSTPVFERWMDVMDYASTEEGYAMTVMGLPEIDFTRNSRGEYVSLLPPGVQLGGNPGEAKYPSMGYILGSVKLWDDFAFVNPNIEPKYRNESWTLYRERCEIATPLTFAKTDWDLYTYDSRNRRMVNYQYHIEFANMVTTATSVTHLESIWRAWINAQNSIVQPVLNELNSMRR